MGSAALSEAIKSIRDWSMTEGRVSTTRRRRPPMTSAASCSTTRCSRSGSRSRRTARCARRSRAASRSTSATADAVATALKDWAVEHGATHYTHWFQPLTGITAEKHDSFLVADQRRRRDRRVPRQGADQGRARRVELPVGRHALHVRSARLHGVGSDQPAVAARQRQQRHARHPDGVRQLDRRGARQEDAAAALDGSGLEAGRARAEAVRLDGRARVRDLRSRAGILPDRPQLLFRASRPDQRRPHAVRRQAAQGAVRERAALFGASWRPVPSRAAASSCVRGFHCLRHNPRLCPPALPRRRHRFAREPDACGGRRRPVAGPQPTRRRCSC